MTSVDQEGNPEQEAAARDGLVKAFHEATRFSHDRGEVTLLISQDGSQEILLVAEDGMGDGYVQVGSDQEKWYVTDRNGPRKRISTSATNATFKKNSETHELEHKELGETASVGKMEELAGLIRGGRKVENTKEGVAGGHFAIELDRILPPDSGVDMAVVETTDGKVLVGRSPKGGFSFASESGETYFVSPNGKFKEAIPDVGAMLSGRSAESDGPDAKRITELTEALQNSTPVELPEDPAERLGFLQSLDLDPHIDFSRSEEPPEADAA